jgi:hypothetical protein
MHAPIVPRERHSVRFDTSTHVNKFGRDDRAEKFEQVPAGNAPEAMGEYAFREGEITQLSHPAGASSREHKIVQSRT